MADRQTVDTQLAIAEFLRSAYAAVGPDLADVWRRLTAGALGCLPVVDHASITLVDARGSVRPFASTDREMALLDDVQRQYLEGPSLDAARHRIVYVIDDLVVEARWPTFTANTTRTVIRSLCAFPLFTHEVVSGALTLCSDRPGAFVDDARSQCAAFALGAATLADAAHREKRLHQLLTSREQIGQAKGMLMERFNFDPMSAHSMLVRMAEERREPVLAIARNMVRSRKAGGA